MQRRRRVGLVVATLALAVGACAEGAEPAEPAEWAAGLCAAQQQFAEAIATSRDEVIDPSNLELAARKERAARRGEAEIAAAKELQEDLEAIEPPEDANEFHDALIAQAKELAKAIEEQVEAIDKATTAQQIAVANASVRFARQGSDTEVTAKFADVPTELVDALVAECGGVPVPGTTQTPVATPSA